MEAQSESKPVRMGGRISESLGSSSRETLGVAAASKQRIVIRMWSGVKYIREVSMRKWIALAGVVLSAVVLSAATYASHIGKCPLCWGK